MVITSSQLRENCFKRWYYKYHLLIDESKIPDAKSSMALDTGIEFHKLWADGHEIEVPETLAQTMWKAYSLCQEVPGYHLDYVIEDKEKFLAKRLKVNESSDVVIAGRIDGIGHLDNESVIVELKTGKNNPSESYWQEKEFDIQLSCYCYLTGIKKVILDYIRRPSIAAVKKSDWDAVLEEMLEKADTYFYRLIVSRTEDDFVRFEKIARTWAEVINCQFRIGEFLQCGGACNDYFARCAFAPFCNGELKVEDMETREPFPELQPEIRERLLKLKEEEPF